MPINKPSTRVFFDEENLRVKFKQLAAQLRISMSQRLIQFIKADVSTWENTGEPLNFDLVQSQREIQTDSHEQNEQEGNREDEQLALACWKKLVNGTMPTPQEITLLCGVLGVLEYRELEERLRCIANKGKITNGA
ncbi:MAG: hypothetical protein WBB43_09765 [Limnoraphis sp.]